MKIFWIILLGFFSTKAWSQKPLSIKQFTFDKWVHECRYLNVKKSTFYYTKNFDPESVSSSLETIAARSTFKDWYHRGKFADSITFTNSEIDTLKSELNKLLIHEWSSKLFPRSKCIAYDEADKLIDLIDSSKLSLEEKLCSKVFTFAPPFYLRNKTICIFLSEAMNILKLEGGVWIYLHDGKDWVQYAPLSYASGINAYRKKLSELRF